jgi:hypothetical protein
VPCSNFADLSALALPAASEIAGISLSCRRHID